MLHIADRDPVKYLKKLIGKRDIEAALNRLDRLTQDEARMAIMQVLKVAHHIKNGAEIVGDQVNGVDHKVKDVSDKVSKTLDEKHEQVLEEIGIANRDHAHHLLLQCLSVAIRPLSVEELAAILVLDFDEAPMLNKDQRWEGRQRAVSSACSSLVTLVDDGNFCVIRFPIFRSLTPSAFPLKASIRSWPSLHT
jgi:hypothetical protein